MLTQYSTNLKTIKRIPNSEKGEKPAIINLSKLVPGIHDIKLRHWFQGKDVQAWKIRLTIDRNGNPHLPEGISPKDLSICFAEPGESELNAFTLPGFAGQHNLKTVLEQFNIEIDRNANLTKLPKRLKRALLVGCVVGTNDVDIQINPDWALPVPFIDGCFLVSRTFIRKLLQKNGRKERIRAYDTIQASLAWGEGLVKGTAIIMPDLDTDIIVQECNIKREVRFHGTPLFTIEDFQHARTPRTDLQTIGNLDAAETIRRVAEHHLGELARIADEPDAADRWFREEFKHHDWWKTAVRNHLKKGKPLPTQIPNLSRARSAGLKHVSHTPVLKEQVYRHACKTLDIRGLKARFPKGEAIAGYMIPDVSRIDSEGFLKDAPDALLGAEIEVPHEEDHYLNIADPDIGREVVVTRNPNAWGEAIIRMARRRPKWSSRTAVQISLDDCMDEEEQVLKIWGGADMDDSLCIWGGDDMLTAYHRSEEERVANDVPRVDLEQYIDSAVQDASGYSLDLAGQMALAAKVEPLNLGQIVNFFMNLRMCRKYEWYRLAAQAKATEVIDEKGRVIKTSAVEELKKVYDLYNKTHYVWADIFCPDPDIVAEGRRDQNARVPSEMGVYLRHIMCLTTMGDVVRDLTDRIYNMLEVEKTTNLLHDGARITTEEGIAWLHQQVDQQAARTRSSILEWGWRALTSRNPVRPMLNRLMDEFVHKIDYNLKLQEDRTFEGRRLKEAEWGRLCGRVLTGNEEWDRQIVANLAIIMLGKDRRFNKETGWYEARYGIDSIMWNTTFGGDGEVIKQGVPDIWISLLKDFENHLNGTVECGLVVTEE